MEQQLPADVTAGAALGVHEYYTIFDIKRNRLIHLPVFCYGFP
jgi:hypothetical protein